MDFLFVEVFAPGEFIHVLLPQHLLDAVVEDLLYHHLAIGGLLEVLEAESLHRFDDDIEFVGLFLKGELALDIEGDG